jgi:hypothetical protein
LQGAIPGGDAIFEQFIENFDEYAENRSRNPKIMKMIDRSGLVQK